MLVLKLDRIVTLALVVGLNPTQPGDVIEIFVTGPSEDTECSAPEKNTQILERAIHHFSLCIYTPVQKLCVSSVFWFGKIG